MPHCVHRWNENVRLGYGSDRAHFVSIVRTWVLELESRLSGQGYWLPLLLFVVMSISELHGHCIHVVHRGIHEAKHP